MKKISILLIVLSICFYAQVIFATPNCNVYGAEESDQYWQMEFGCFNGPIGIVTFLNNGQVMSTRLYFYFFNSQIGDWEILVPGIATLIERENALWYQDLNIVFFKE